MSIVAENQGSSCLIRLTRSFDFSCRNDFRTAYSLAAAGSSFVVDMTEVDYLDSAALGMLLLLRDFAGDPKRVTLQGAKGQPEQVLRIANFHKLFKFA